ncbi:hypothetical protein QBC41DRAFT_240974 [Cercophora samala]|uniref:C2H2-type domain-containing protein n=1 Tax=Cercophora samala TaxID=330535 RepID=A0AA39ZLY9_9PEZI|nr:hypothetical protein QBC41DRAFT_240974 [Cercophora samala]
MTSEPGPSSPGQKPWSGLPTATGVFDDSDEREYDSYDVEDDEEEEEGQDLYHVYDDDEAELESTELWLIGTRIFTSFRAIASLENSGWEAAQRDLELEGQRFTLWSHGLGLHQVGHASLDYRVRDAMVVKRRLAEVLTDLAGDLEELHAVMSGERAAYEDEGDTDSDSASSKRSIDAEGLTCRHSAASSNYTDSSESFHEVDFRLQSVTETIESLYSLALRIRNPRNRPQRPLDRLYKHIAQELREEYIRDRENAEIAVVSSVQRHCLQLPVPTRVSQQEGTQAEVAAEVLESTITPEMTDKYASKDNFLVRRVGIANARRKQQFMYWRKHAARIRAIRTDAQLSNLDVKGKQPLREHLAPAVTQTSGNTRTVPTRAERSLATTATKLDANILRPNNTKSVASSRSLASTIITQQGRKLEWPTPPTHLIDRNTKAFTCPFCHIICPESLLDRNQWRSHVVHDLMPYLCTYEDCSDPDRLYSSHREWLNHENEHTYVWHCASHQQEFETEDDYTGHIKERHPDARPEHILPEYVAEQIRPSLKPKRDCPLCPTVFETVVEMQKHMKIHLERLAIICFPSVGKGGRAASLKEDFDRIVNGFELLLWPDGRGPESCNVIRDNSPSQLSLRAQLDIWFGAMDDFAEPNEDETIEQAGLVGGVYPPEYPDGWEEQFGESNQSEQEQMYYYMP